MSQSSPTVSLLMFFIHIYIYIFINIVNHISDDVSVLSVTNTIKQLAQISQVVRITGCKHVDGRPEFGVLSSPHTLLLF